MSCRKPRRCASRRTSYLAVSHKMLPLNADGVGEARSNGMEHRREPSGSSGTPPRRNATGQGNEPGVRKTGEKRMRRTAKAPCRRKGRSQRQKMEPGAMHGPTRVPLYMVSPVSPPARRRVLRRRKPIADLRPHPSRKRRFMADSDHEPRHIRHTHQAPHRDSAVMYCCGSPSTATPPKVGTGTPCTTILLTT